MTFNYMLQIKTVLLVSAAGTVRTEQIQHMFNGSQQTRKTVTTCGYVTYPRMSPLPIW